MSAAIAPPSRRTAGSGARSDRAFFVVAILVGLLIGARILATVGSLPNGENARVDIHAFSDDARRYHDIADADGVPYRDDAVEFPPAALGFIEVVNGQTVGETMGRLGWASLVLDLLAASAVAYGWGRRALLAYLVIGMPFFYLPFVYFRVDLLSVALAAWGLALVKRKRDTSGGVLLAVAVFAKLWPLALLPLLIVERRWKALRAAVAVGATGAVAWFAVAGFEGFEQVLTFRHAKGWQMESVTGGVIRAFTGETTRLESGAVRFGTVPTGAMPLLALVMLGAMVCIWVGVSRRPKRESITFAVAPIAAICAFMICSPLLSPQYLIWLLPFAAVAWVTGERVLALLVMVASAATMMLTQSYGSLNRDELVGQLVLNCRNALLVGIALYAGFLIWRKPSDLADAPELVPSGDVEHALQRDAGPLCGSLVDDDLVDDFPAHERLEHPCQVGTVDSEHRGAGAHERVE